MQDYYQYLLDGKINILKIAEDVKNAVEKKNIKTLDGIRGMITQMAGDGFCSVLDVLPTILLLQGIINNIVPAS